MVDKHKSGKNQDELEMDQLANAELNRLQRQYRIMESDRLKFAESAAARARRGAQFTAALQRERDVLRDRCEAGTRPDAKKRVDEAAVRLGRCLDRHDELRVRIAKEKNEIEELDMQIARVTKSIDEINKSSSTEQQLVERDQAQERAVKKLEDTLDCEIKKYNAVVADNSRLREDISHLIRERGSFNSAWSEIERRLGEGKRRMSELIEASSAAYDQRDDLCRKLQALKARGQADMLLHTQETRELQRRLDHDRKLQEFLEIKGRRRVMHDLEAREAAKKQKLKEAAEEKTAKYKDIVAQIMEFSKEKDPERLGAQFVKQEEENFALFNYVNELNQEVELLTTTVNELKEKISEQHSINQQREQNQGQALNLMRQELEERKNRAKELDEKKLKVEERLQFLMNVIEEVFMAIRCDNAPILRLLGETSTITTDNITLYLALIEKKVAQMLRAICQPEPPIGAVLQQSDTSTTIATTTAKKQTGTGQDKPHKKSRHSPQDVATVAPAKPGSF